MELIYSLYIVIGLGLLVLLIRFLMKRCSHVYKEEKEEFLEQRREGDGLPGLQTYSLYNYYAIHYKCIKCGKEKIEVNRKMII